MFFRKSKLISELRAEIQRLREALAEAIGARDAYREQAREAIGLAKEKHFPQNGVEEWRDKDGNLQMRWRIGSSSDIWANPKNYLADPDPFSVKNCPECCVSVRADSWPQICPACKTSFGDGDWPDTIG